jgi:N6-adenosine-specific RNA methylase IME4/ParB-like chromosome segregation protein Spo0J
MTEHRAFPIERICVGERHRRDMGDIAGVAASLDEIGLLQAIGITPGGTLIWGERRLRAAKLLGWTDIPVKIVNVESIARAEDAENTIRKDFTLSEAVAIKRALEPIEREAAKQRQGSRTDKHPGKLPTSSKGRAADKAAQATGMARRTLEKAEAIVNAAEAEPAKFRKLLDDMDRTGRLNGVYRRLKIAKQAERIRAEPSPLPGNHDYRVAGVDFPWPYEDRQEDPSHRAVHPYPTMSIAQICETKAWLPALMHDDAVLWLWCTNYYLIRYAAPVLDALGFTEKTILTWVKPKFGCGDWLRGQTEHCVLAVRGNPTVTLTNESTVLFAPARGHSVKPPEFYDLVERLCPAPRYLDVYSRYRHNDKWDCYGDEAPPPTDDGIPEILRRSAP